MFCFVRFKIEESLDVTIGNDQNVARIDGMNIHKACAEVVLVDFATGKATFNNFTERAGIARIRGHDTGKLLFLTHTVTLKAQDFRVRLYLPQSGLNHPHFDPRLAPEGGTFVPK